VSGPGGGAVTDTGGTGVVSCAWPGCCVVRIDIKDTQPKSSSRANMLIALLLFGFTVWPH
jgi:hypothetical protein